MLYEVQATWRGQTYTLQVQPQVSYKQRARNKSTQESELSWTSRPVKASDDWSPSHHLTITTCEKSK